MNKGFKKKRVVAIAAASVMMPLVAAVPASATTGAEARDGARSFTVRLDIGKGTRGCSGVLVDAQWVLTARSCFADNPATSIDIPAGAPALRTTATVGRTDLTTGTGEVREVVQLVPRTDRDVTLARLDKPVAGVAPVTVGTRQPSAGETLTAAGFGRTKTEWAPLRLHTATLGIDAVQSQDISFHGQDGQALCAGDTGGPLLRESGGNAELVGINSRSYQGGCFGIEATETRSDGISSRVADLGDWIAKNRLAARAPEQIKHLTTGDFNRDGHPDIAAILDDNNLYAFYGTSDGKLTYGRELWAHDGTWGSKARILGGDFNGDGNADIAALKDDSAFHHYAGTSGDLLSPAASMWKDKTFASYLPTTYRAKGWTRDGLVAIAPTGRLYAYATGANGILTDSRTEVWHDATWDKKFLTSADFNGDGLNDIAAISQKGELALYPGKTDGTFANAKLMWEDASWGGFHALLSGDFNGDGNADIVILNSVDHLYLYPGDGKGGLGTRRSMWPAIG
ncbi:trypsin-like serine protease [Streptomyces sp. NPDC002248]